MSSLDPQTDRAHVAPVAGRAPSVLLAVDDGMLRHSVEVSLHACGYSVRSTDVPDALDLAAMTSPDIIIVELGFVGEDSSRLFERVRRPTDAYVVAITPPDSALFRVRALRAGADDAVTVPVSGDEIAARCQALMRRPRTLRTRWEPSSASLIAIGPLTVDVGRRRILISGREVPATRTEYALFEHLCRHPAEVSTRVRLNEHVWGPGGTSDAHVIDVHLSNLRRKLQVHAPHLRFIHTVRGIGFRLSDDLLQATAGPAHALASA